MSAVDQIGIPESAVCLFAHPDDPEFLAGGMIAKWTDAGCRMSYVIMTDGRAGVQGLGDTPISDADLVQMRQDEQRAAGALLGVEDITFLAHRDGELFHTLELRRELVREIRRIKPQAAILFDPLRRVMPGYVQHPDHWISGEAALAAIFPLSGNRRTFEDMFAEGLTPHQITDIYLCSPVEPNLRVDITATVDRKIEAMRCHHSQVADPERVGEMMKERTKTVGNDGTVTYAETYHFLRFGARDFTLDPIR